MLTSEEITAAYEHPIVAELRALLVDAVYTPEEFGMFLALPNRLIDGKSDLELIHDGRGEEVLRWAREIVELIG